MPIFPMNGSWVNISTLRNSSLSISTKDQSSDQRCMFPSALGSLQSCSAWPRVGRISETGFYVLSRVCVAWNSGRLATSPTCPRRSCVGSTPTPPMNQCGQCIANQGTVNWTIAYDDLTSQFPCMFPFRPHNFSEKVVFITWRPRNILKPELAYSWRLVLSLLG